MDSHFIEIDFNPDVEKLLARLGLESDSDEGADFLALLEQALPHAKPRAFLGAARVESLADDGAARIGGVELHSSLFAINLKEVETVWPYLASCGRELYDFAQSIADPFERYWVDEIMQQALADVRVVMETTLSEKIHAGKTAAMGPGSLPEWPIGQQRPLFELLGPATEFCGVTLTDTMLMLPHKSVSGIRFPNEHGYVNCRLCPKERCHNRRAAYDAGVAAAYREC